MAVCEEVQIPFMLMLLMKMHYGRLGMGDGRRKIDMDDEGDEDYKDDNKDHIAEDLLS